MAKKTTIKNAPQIQRLKPQAGKRVDYPVVIAPGMFVRVEPTGRKTFRWDRGSGHKPRVLVYGSFPSLSLEQACREHAKAKQRHQDGVDVGHGDGVPKTVAELAEVFFENRIVPHRKVPGDVRRTLDNDILPALGRMQLRSVSAPAIHAMVRKVVERGSPVHARKVLAHTKQLFRYAVSMGVLDHSPAESLEAINVGAQDNRRDRVLSGDEIRDLFSALEQPSKISLTTKVGLRLLLLTGLRSGELRQTKWEDVDLDAGTLTVPVANQKLSKAQERHAKDFVCTLPHQAVQELLLLEGLDPIWVFPGKYSGPLSKLAFSKAVRRLLKDGDLDIPQFTPHDLRRTLRSGLSSLRVPPHVAERCLNHSLGRIAETYDVYDYEDERREALQRWADHMDVHLGKSENVLPLSQTPRATK